MPEHPVEVTIVFSPEYSLSAEIWAKTLAHDNEKYGKDCFKLKLEEANRRGIFKLVVKRNGSRIIYDGSEIPYFIAQYSCHPARMMDDSRNYEL